jgi:predicted dehydrogenase
MGSSKVTRVALVGLTAKGEGFTWLNAVHLPYLRAHPDRFEIVAVQGSSVEAAQAAVAKFELPLSVKTYGSPQSLAEDGDIDLVVHALPTPVHYATLKPLFEGKKKDFIIEWPVAQNPQQSYQLLDAASAAGSRVCFGLQGAFTKINTRLAEIIRDGTIGDIRSSVLVGMVTPYFPREDVLERDGGSTLLDIYLPQFLASFLQIFGPIESLNCSTSIQQKHAVVSRLSTQEVMDEAFAHARLSSGAVATWNLRFGTSFSGGLKWVISGSKGEIEITNDLSFCTWINIAAFPSQLRVANEDGKVIVEEVVKEDGDGQVAVGKLWDAFSRGRDEGVYDVAKARNMVRIIEALWSSADNGGAEVQI